MDKEENKHSTSASKSENNEQSSEKVVEEQKVSGDGVEKEDGVEFVCCIPLDNLIGYEFKPSRAAVKVFDLHKNKDEVLRYYKTLIFGKVETEQLKIISKWMEIWQEWFI